MPSPDELPTRRDFLAAAGAATASALLPPAFTTLSPEPIDSALSGASPLGHWIDDDFGLPAFNYTGPLRFPSSPVYEGSPMLPDDPFFLTGNDRLTLFTHASGALQLLTGERAWGRMNQDSDPSRFTGAYQATVEIDDAKHSLVGLDEPAAQASTKRFGVGFARYDYTLAPALAVTRRISVLPSAKAGEGTSACLVEILLRNTGSQPLKLRYLEALPPRYQPIFAPWNPDRHEVSYVPQPAVTDAHIVIVRFTAKPRRRLAFPPPGEMSRLEQFPPALFVATADTSMLPVSTGGAVGNWLGAVWGGMLAPAESRRLAFVLGYSRDSDAAIRALASQLQPGPSLAPIETLGSAFGAAWRKKIPPFANEADPVLQREMQWNAAVLEQMATWREYYDETVIPQGTVYDYTWGMVGSMRDQAQHALPLCHTNPALACSTLRFIMKRTLPDGNILLNDGGFGWSPSGAQQTSDQQLYFFLLLTEYLRVTGDNSILTDTIGYYPLENSGRSTGLAHLRQCFLFLRDRVSLGPRGLVLRWNSDWNDMFGWWPSPHPYNSTFTVSESHMNSAMAIVILGDLADIVEKTGLPDTAEFTAALGEYRSQLLTAFLRDLGDRAFPRRAYLWTDSASALGEKEMWLEPQGFTLLIPELSTERKRRLYAELERRILQGEALGPRQIETPAVQPGTPQGSRENGGFWYALNGPVLLGAASFDPAAAEDLLRRMTFANFAQKFPNYWTGQWSASDSLDSSLLRTNGLSSGIPWCAHAHAWPLYCWLRLRESQPPA